MATTFRPLKIGAGGFLCGIDISPDGLTMLCRADAFGGYIWDSGNLRWQQLCDSNRMPAGDRGPDDADGVFELRCAPSNSAVIYMAYGNVLLQNMYKSTNRGVSFSRLTGFTPLVKVSGGANGGPPRFYNRKMAVDPADPNVCYVSGGSAAGAFRTLDGGTTWSAVPSVPTNGIHPATASDSMAGHALIAFDSSGGTTGGKTNNIYITSCLHGMWRSTDAGSTFTQVTGGPGTTASFSHLKVAVDGRVYALQDVYQIDPNKVWRLVGGTTWTDITPSGGQSYQTLAPDPNNASRLIGTRSGGYINITTNATAATPTWGGYSGTHTRVASDIPWMATGNTLEEFMGESDTMFDPLVADKLWIAEGIGIWYTTGVPTSSPTSTVWTSQNAGIEELVASQVLAPPGGRPVMMNHDRAIFYSVDSDAYPTYQAWISTKQLPRSFGGDWASNDPTFMVSIVNTGFDVGSDQSCYSTNGGQTWTIMPAFPPYFNVYPGGCIAAASSSNWVWVGSNNAANPYYTTNGGTTWNAITISGVPTSGWTGWGWAFYHNRFIVAADRVNVGTFYLFNSGSDSNQSFAGIYKTTNGGVSWTHEFTGCITSQTGSDGYIRDANNAKLRSVPNLSGSVSTAGHLFFTGGGVGGGGDNTRDSIAGLFHSTNGGTTWSRVVNVSEIYDFGFGAVASGATYPTIYCFGWVDGGSGYTLGMWRGDSFNPSTHTATWTLLADWPAYRQDSVNTIDGDKSTYGTVYIGYQGSGYLYGALDSAPPPSGMRLIYRKS